MIHYFVTCHLSQFSIDPNVIDKFDLTVTSDSFFISADSQLNEHKQSASTLNNMCKRQNNMVAITTNLYTWMMKQFVLTELYHGDGRQGEMICDRLIPSFSGDAPLREDFLFMKGMCVIQQALFTGSTPGFDVIRPMVALATLDKQSWKWMVCNLLSSIRIT